MNNNKSTQEDDRSLPSIFRLARNVSKLSDHKKHKLGAVIVVNGKPLSVGCNRQKTDPHALFTGLHAEIVAIGATGKNFIKGSSIFVYREKKNGDIGLAKPCPECMKALKEFGIKKIYYSTETYPYFEVERI